MSFKRTEAKCISCGEIFLMWFKKSPRCPKCNKTPLPIDPRHASIIAEYRLFATRYHFSAHRAYANFADKHSRLEHHRRDWLHLVTHDQPRTLEWVERRCMMIKKFMNDFRNGWYDLVPVGGRRRTGVAANIKFYPVRRFEQKKPSCPRGLSHCNGGLYQGDCPRKWNECSLAA